jgi:hypothetical protein
VRTRCQTLGCWAAQCEGSIRSSSSEGFDRKVQARQKSPIRLRSLR